VNKHEFLYHEYEYHVCIVGESCP